MSLEDEEEVNRRANEIMHQSAKNLTSLQITQLAEYLSSR